MTLTATITARGAASSTAHDHDDGSVDATVYEDGTEIGSCTLVPFAWDGQLDVWGDRDMWATDDLSQWLDRTAERYDCCIEELIYEIVCAARTATND